MPLETDSAKIKSSGCNIISSFYKNLGGKNYVLRLDILGEVSRNIFRPRFPFPWLVAISQHPSEHQYLGAI